MFMDDYYNENIYWNFNYFNNCVIKVVWFEIIYEFKNENLDRNRIVNFFEFMEKYWLWNW